MEFERYAARALDTALQRGASYADLRYERIREERIEVRNGEVATLSDERSSGYGIRAFYEGAWGFAASDDMSNQGVDRTAARAVAIAKASACGADRALCRPLRDTGRARSAGCSARSASRLPPRRREAFARRAKHPRRASLD